MDYPIIYSLLAYIAGIFLSRNISFQKYVFLIIAVILTAVIIQIISEKIRKNILILTAFFLFGSVMYFVNYNNMFSPINNYEGKYIELEGCMCGLPRKYEGGITSFEIMTEKIRYKDKEFKIKDKIRISAKGEYAYGLKIKAEGFLESFDGQQNTHGYDAKIQNKIKGVSYKMFADEDCIEIVGKSKPHSINDIYNRYSEFVLNRINTYYSNKESDILKIVLFGDYNVSNDEMDFMINRSGVGRFLRSGYINLLILTVLLEKLLRGIKVPKNARDITVCIFVMIFVLVNNNSPSFVRTGIFFIVYIIYTKYYGYLYKPDAIAAAVFVMLIFNPLLIFGSGFVSSVSAVIFIYLFREHIENILKRIIKNKKLRRVIAVYLICSVTLIPVNLCFYNNFSTGTFLYMLIFPPITAAIILLMPINALLLANFKSGFIFYYIIKTAVFIINSVIESAMRMPVNSVIIPTPHKVFIVFLIVVIYILWLYFEKCEKTTIMVWGTVAAVFGIISLVNYISEYGNVNISFINVGQGDSCVISVKGKENIVIDGGGSGVYSDYNVGKNITVPYIHSMCGDKIDMLIVSHYHKDHCDGVLEILKNCRVKYIVMPDCDDGDYRGRIEKIAKLSDVRIIYADNNYHFEYPSGLKIKFLLPDENMLKSEDLNVTSIVAKVEYGEFDAMFMGDMTKEDEEKLLGRSDIRNIDVLKAGHHGSATSSCEEFIQYASPVVSIVSVGADNSYGLPDKAVMSRLNMYSKTVYTTAEHGDITVCGDKRGLREIKMFK